MKRGRALQKGEKSITFYNEFSNSWKISDRGKPRTKEKKAHRRRQLPAGKTSTPARGYALSQGRLNDINETLEAGGEGGIGAIRKTKTIIGGRRGGRKDKQSLCLGGSRGPSGLLQLGLRRDYHPGRQRNRTVKGEREKGTEKKKKKTQEI